MRQVRPRKRRAVLLLQLAGLACCDEQAVQPCLLREPRLKRHTKPLAVRLHLSIPGKGRAPASRIRVFHGMPSADRVAAEAPAPLSALRREQQLKVAKPRVLIPPGMHGTRLAQRQTQGATILHARLSAARQQRAARPRQAVGIRVPGHRFLLQRRAAYAARVAQAVPIHEVAYGLRRVLCKGDERLPHLPVLRDGLPRRLPACRGRQRERQQHQQRFDKCTLHTVPP